MTMPTADNTNLYKIVYAPVGLDEQIVELARARSFTEAAAVVRDYLLETYDDGWADCRWINVQLIREPEGVGICYEPAGHEQTFVVEGGRLQPTTGPLLSHEGTEVTDTGY
jgi:hypothetical protein